MKPALFFLFITVVSQGCSLKYRDLARYYESNASLHREIADSLISFAVKHKTRVIVRQRPDLHYQIDFYYYVRAFNTNIIVEFDSALNRNDPYPKHTAGITIPKDLIMAIKRTVYRSINADSNEVFFSYNHYFDGNTHYGILEHRDIAKSRYSIIKSLDSNVFIAKGVVR